VLVSKRPPVATEEKHDSLGSDSMFPGAQHGKSVPREVRRQRISLRTEHCSKRTVIANTLRHLTITCRRHVPDVDRIIHSFSKEENLMKQRTRAT